MTTPDQVSQSILATLSTTIPGLSCEIGTPERKIIDAVAEAIAEAYVGNYLSGSLFDIDSKTGLELEEFVGIFGFGRLQGQAATGTVQVTLSTVSTSDTTFALATQFYTTPGLAGVSSTLYYASTSAVILTAGNLTASIPVQCTTVGTAGNVPPDSITYLGSTVGGSTVTNLTAMTGGVDIETDQELRQRFKDTLLRNIAGTSDFYEALCQQNNNVSRVVVFGPISLYETQIAVPSTELVLPVNQDVKYAWPLQESVFSDLGQETETFYSPLTDYTYAGGTSPTFNTVGGGVLATMVGQVVDLEFQYTTRSSRNDPLNGITNKIDIFVDGVNPMSVTEQTVVSASTLSSTSSDSLYTGNFKRVGSTGAPLAGNRFMRLGSVPIVSFPSTLTAGGGISGQLVTLASATGGTFTLTYADDTTTEIAYNALASDVQVALEALAEVGEGNVVVNGPEGGPYTVSFEGALLNTSTVLTADGTELGGSGASVAVMDYSEGSSGGVVYTQGTHYYLLQDATLLQGSQQEVSGIEWTSAGPATGTELTLNYVYNNVPQVLDALVATAKQITTDVLVHQGTFAYIQPCVSVEYDRSYSVATVNSSIINRLQTYFAQLPFGAPVKLSNIMMYVQQTLGVVDVKVTTSDQNSQYYGVQIFNNSSDPSPALVETDDFKLSDNQLAVYQGVQITRVATP